MGEQADDIEWFTPDGATMTEDDWKVTYARSIGVFLNGDAITALGTRGQRVVDDSFYAVFNAYEGELDFVLPSAGLRRAVDRGARHHARRPRPGRGARPDGASAAADPGETPVLKAGDHLTVGGRAVVVLRAIRPE